MSAKGKPPVVVVGTIFVDLKCFPKYELNFRGRNPGTARFFHGGVGRNVAETMGLLGSDVRFASSVQEGGIGHEVLHRLNEAGVEVDAINVSAAPDAHGMWVAILHRDGDLACSISQMPDTRYMEEAWAKHGQRILRDAKLAVLEFDLSDRLAQSVLCDATAAGVPVVGLPGNFECIRRRPDLLPLLNMFICNQVEAEELVGGKPISSIPAARAAAKAMLALGLEQAVITLGAQGAVALARGWDEPYHVAALPVDVVDTTGAGDAFVAGLSHALAAGAGLKRAVEAAARVAAWTVSSTESVCRDIRQRIAADRWEGWGEIAAASRQTSFKI
ncbi:MAG TPA: PfkB family carbohydrate kinase [Symbiobacteriaceae bacterium]|nr:PfkB family carbohydrate kinase [Symbiobacteriaceae bacterium]